MSLWCLLTPLHHDFMQGILNKVISILGVPVSRFEFTWIDLAVTSLLANQPVASESSRARYQCLHAAVTLPVNLSFSFASRVSRHLIYFIAVHRQLTVSIVVSAIFVFILVTVFWLAVFTLFNDLITNSNCLQTQTVTPGRL